MNRLCGNNRTVRWHNYVPLFRVRRHPSSQHPILRVLLILLNQQHHLWKSNRVQRLRVPLYLHYLRFLPHGQRLDLLPHFRRPLQPRRYSRHGSRQSLTRCASHLSIFRPDLWRDCCVCYGAWFVPYPAQCQNNTGWRR